MPYTAAFVDALANHLYRGTASPADPAGYLLALSTTDPGADGTTMTEPSTANGYARLAVSPADLNAAAGGSGTCDNAAVLSFPDPTGPWGTITHVCLLKSDGTFIYSEPANPAGKSYDVGDRYTFDPGNLALQALTQ